MVWRTQGSSTTVKGLLEISNILDLSDLAATPVMTCIDRPARSTHNLQTIVAHLKEEGGRLAAAEQPVGTSTPADKALFEKSGLLAKFEVRLRRERQAERIKATKRIAVCRGSPPKVDMSAIQVRPGADCSSTESAREMEISCGNVYQAMANTPSYGMVYVRQCI